MSRLAVVLLLALSLRGCVAYEFEHEFWIRVDGSGTVNVTARPELWGAMKGVRVSPTDEDAAGQITFHLNRAEDAGCIVNLLSLSDEDVLVEVGAGTRALRPRGCCRQYK